LGWEAAWFSEIEKFPCAVLAHHHPDVVNLGDMLTITEEQVHALGRIDVLVGGTPCQSFSVAGLRGGLEDARGNLALRFVQLADMLRPRWVVWENVPGVLSSGAGRDFGSIVGALAKLGYGWAYRIVDAQYCGVPQRRRRVFVVGYLGDWRRAAAVLLERESLCGNPPPSRGKRENASAAVAPSVRSRGPGFARTGDSRGPGFARTGDSRGQDCVVAVADEYIPEVSPAIKARDHKGPSSDGDGDGDGAPLIAHALRGNGFDGSEDGTGRGIPIIPILEAGKRQGTMSKESRLHIAFHGSQDPDVSGDVTHPLGMNHGLKACVGIDYTNGLENDDLSGTIEASQARVNRGQGVLAEMHVRRLTPRECERLQGFPDDYTLIPYHGKCRKPAKDGPRYKAIGNSMAVPVMEWIGRRIEMVEAMKMEMA